MVDGLAELRRAIGELPDSAGVIIEDKWNRRFTIEKSYSFGQRTEGPGLMIRLRETARTHGPSLTDDMVVKLLHSYQHDDGECRLGVTCHKLLIARQLAPAVIWLVYGE